ncbi:Nif11 family protein [Pseudodesulfovibrio sp. zrk46]|uniref:Nif11 family protein n=1 Tax=Pseudodesulfovibrio sp. zrk46 TaxID=2725288 RepID=UPI001448C24D|nr:Nif11 family protein [Pseudodesulfovibrio sp. zrk46]QJB55547.1 Nif11 family protein [Pseudodesulfovibrio sp. zrk46]
MSKEELSRLVSDVMSNPAMIAEAMSITDQAAMEAYITSKGYDLTKDEMLEVWAMAAKVMAGHAQPMEATEALIDEAKGK